VYIHDLYWYRRRIEWQIAELDHTSISVWTR